jgi:hypothetical protein
MKISINVEACHLSFILYYYFSPDSFSGPPTSTRDMGVELCPNNKTLKLSWKMNKIKG